MPQEKITPENYTPFNTCLDLSCLLTVILSKKQHLQSSARLNHLQMKSASPPQICIYYSLSTQATGLRVSILMH